MPKKFQNFAQYTRIRKLSTPDQAPDTQSFSCWQRAPLISDGGTSMSYVYVMEERFIFRLNGRRLRDMWTARSINHIHMPKESTWQYIMAPTLMFIQTPSNEHSQCYKLLTHLNLWNIYQCLSKTSVLLDVKISKHDSMISPRFQTFTVIWISYDFSCVIPPRL
jgi:hypothetical protein